MAQRHRTSPAPEATRNRIGVPSWESVNIGPVERAVRIVVGLQAMFGGVLLLAGTASVIWAVPISLLAFAGAGLLVTGTYGHSPLYRKLGHLPASLRKPRGPRPPGDRATGPTQP